MLCISNYPTAPFGRRKKRNGGQWRSSEIAGKGMLAVMTIMMIMTMTTMMNECFALNDCALLFFWGGGGRLDGFKAFGHMEKANTLILVSGP